MAITSRRAVRSRLAAVPRRADEDGANRNGARGIYRGLFGSGDAHGHDGADKLSSRKAFACLWSCREGDECVCLTRNRFATGGSDDPPVVRSVEERRRCCQAHTASHHPTHGRRVSFASAESTTSVSGRSPPSTNSLRQIPELSWYTTSVVSPPTCCRPAASSAAASAASWVGKVSENTSPGFVCPAAVMLDDLVTCHHAFSTPGTVLAVKIMCDGASTSRRRLCRRA